MTKHFRLIAALGAVLFVTVGLVACGGGVPANAVVADRRHNRSRRTRSTTGWPWRPPRARRRRGRKAGRARPARTTRPASRTSKRPPRNRQRPEAADRSGAEETVRTAVQIAAAGGARLPDLLAVGARRSRARSASSVTDKEVKKQFEKIKNQQFPKPAEFEKFLATSGQTRLRPAAAREAQHALAENPAEDRQGEAESHARREIAEVLQRKQVPLRHAGKAQRADHPDQDRSQAPRRPSRKSNRARASRASPRSVSIDPTSKAKGGKLGGGRQRPGGADARRARSSPPRRTSSAARSRRPFGYYIYEVTGDHARATSSRCRRLEASIKQQLIAHAAAEER